MEKTAGNRVATFSEESTSLRRQLARQQAETEKLRGQLAKLDAYEREITNEFSRQFSQKDQHIRQLLNRLSAKEAEAERLGFQLDSRGREERTYVERLKNALIRRDVNNKKLFAELTAQVEQKEEEVRRLRDELTKPREFSVAEHPPLQADELQLLRKRILDKNRELRHMESRLLEQERSHSMVVRQLQKQHDQQQKHIDHLKQLFTEQQASRKQLEAEYDEALASKDARILELTRRAQEETSPNEHLRQQVTLLQKKLSMKERSITRLENEMSVHKEQEEHLRKKLENEDEALSESEAHYHELLESMKAQHHDHIRDIIRKYSEQEMRLRSEIQGLRARATEHDALLREKQDLIDQSIREFTLKYQQLLKLKGLNTTPEQQPFADKEAELKEREQKLEKEKLQVEEKQAKIASLMEEAEAKIRRAVDTEAAVERREHLLVMEQEALRNELNALSNAGIEIGKTKEYLQSELANVSKKKTTARPKQKDQISTEKAPVAEIATLQAPTTETTVERLTPPPALKSRNTKPEMQAIGNGFNAETYSEDDEIRAMLDVALQHGEDIKQAKESLMRSGYTKDKVEQIAKTIKIV